MSWITNPEFICTDHNSNPIWYGSFSSGLDTYYNSIVICSNINLKIMEIVEQNGSSFAFPTRTIQIESNSSEQITKNS